MLVLTRKQDEQILIGDDVVITVIKIRNNQIRLGISAPRDVRVVRGELELKPTEVTIDLAHPAEPVHPAASALGISADSKAKKAPVNRLTGSRGVSVISGKIKTATGPISLPTAPLSGFFTAP